MVVQAGLSILEQTVHPSRIRVDQRREVAEANPCTLETP